MYMHLPVNHTYLSPPHSHHPPQTHTPSHPTDGGLQRCVVRFGDGSEQSDAQRACNSCQWWCLTHPQCVSINYAGVDYARQVGTVPAYFWVCLLLVWCLIKPVCLLLVRK